MSNGFFSNENQFQDNSNISQRDSLKGFYGNAVRPAYIDDLVKRAEDAASKAEGFRDEAEVIRDETQTIYDNAVTDTTNIYNDTVNVYNDTVGVYNDTVQIKNDTQGIYDATVIIKDDTQTIYDNAVTDTTAIYNDTVGVYDDTVLIKDETLGYRNEAEIFRDEAEAASIATANGVINKGHWDASTGLFPTPTINPVEKADWYRISTGGTMSDGVQEDVTVNAGDNLYWDTYNDVWYAIDNDNTSWHKFTRGEAELNQMREQNHNQFAASGNVHFGKGITPSSLAININEGLYSYTGSDTAPNVLFMGRKLSPVGTSETDFPVFNTAGFVSKVTGINTTSSASDSFIKFPEAPNGTVTYNTSTGEVIQHADASTAFALQDSDSNVEVVINRVDVFGMESYLEEITQTNPYIYPYGCIQSQATTMNGIATERSNRPDTYYAVYDGDTTSAGLGVNFYALTHSQKKTVVSDKDNNIFMLNDGRLVQWRMRQRTVVGLRNGEWDNYDPNKERDFYPTVLHAVLAQGHADSVEPYGLNSDLLKYGAYYRNKQERGVFQIRTLANTPAAVTGECYFHVWGVVPRLNQGVKHWSFNDMGSAKATDGFGYQSALINSTLDCFLNAVDGSIAGADSGRGDGKFHDAIYSSGQGGVIDYRKSAWDMGSKEEASKVFQKVVNGTYRGEELLEKVTVHAIPTSSVSSPQSSSTYPDFKYYPQVWGSATESLVYGKLYYYVYNATQGWISKIIPAKVDQNFTNTTASRHIYYDATLTGASGDELYLVIMESSNIPVSGNFTMQDVIGDPANILATPQLANGWLGGWIPVIPDGVIMANEMPMSRKCITSTLTMTWSEDLSTTWLSADYTVDNVKNSRNNSSQIPAARITMYTYTAFAKQTKQSTNKPVLNGQEGVGGVFAYGGFYRAQDSYGVQLCESLTGKIGTASVGGSGGSSIPMTEVSITPSHVLSSNNTTDLNTHVPITLPVPNNDSPAVKALWHQTADNQEANLNFLWNELVYNSAGTSGNEWGDTVAATDYQNAYGTVKVLSGVGTYTNQNGDVCLAGSNELAISYGYTKNQARAGTQVSGVDL